jgi:hypothetical protein
MRLRAPQTFGLALALAGSLSGSPAARTAAVSPLGETATTGATFESIGTLAFGPNGVLFAADTQAAAILALDLGAQAASARPGAQDVAGVDQKIAALLGTEANAISVSDMVVHPTTRNIYFSVMRGQGAGAAPALVRLDGSGKLDVVRFETLKSSKAALPNAPVANPTDRRNPRAASITDMSFHGGRLVVAGLSNEEFASKLRTIAFPFTTVDAGTSVEIYHGNHGAFETRSPVYAFVPYDIGQTPHIIAAYLCTPLVKFPVASLTQPSAGKIVGTTIAELGNRNRPIDMIVYKSQGKEFLLMSNTSRGVMKIPTESFGTAAGITTRVAEGTAGIGYETIASLKGIEQLDRLDDQRAVVLARAETGGLNLQTVPLP